MYDLKILPKEGISVRPSFAPISQSPPTACGAAGVAGVERSEPPVGAFIATPSPPEWRKALKAAIRDPVELCRLLGLPSEYEAPAIRAAADFGLFAPVGYVARMRRGDPHDPLLRQVLPLAEELEESPQFQPDPVGDLAAAVAPGLLHKYRGRALLITTGVCAVHCRYCFRRHFPYSEGPRSWSEWEPALATLAADPTISEVVLSGGDPLMLGDDWLAQLAGRLAAIGHLRRLRVHTRLPIVLPERVCDDLIGWLRGTRLVPWMVIHANHPAELGGDVDVALAMLVDAGIPVLNQSVLLKGVNDDADVLCELSQRLVERRVTPYYLHQLDKVQGAAHFHVDESVGRRLVAAMRSRLSGYAVPRYVCEVAGETHKRVLE